MHQQTQSAELHVLGWKERDEVTFLKGVLVVWGSVAVSHHHVAAVVEYVLAVVYQKPR